MNEMAKSNDPTDLSSFFRQLIAKQFENIRSQAILIICHDDENMLKLFKELAVTTSESMMKLYVFDDVDECFNFICDKVSQHSDVVITAFAGGQLVCDLVSYLRYCEQVQRICILNKPPFDEEEREYMKTCDKVMYVFDIVSETTTSHSNLSVEQRFSEILLIKQVYEIQSDKDTLPFIEPTDRSFKHFDKDFVFRYLMLMCLLHTPSSPHDKNKFIEFLEINALALPKDIQNFKDNYSTNQSILFYTRDVYIYSKLNKALRTTDIHHLLFYRFILQDISNQLYEQMIQTTSDQILTLYRCQQSSEFEIAELTVAYHRHSPIVINNFLSTSKDKSAALDFLGPGDVQLDNIPYSQILFTITAQKEDASRYFPFADISKISNHPVEKEVLFVPGQMFIINNIEIIVKNKIRIYSIQMSLKSRFDEQFIHVEDKFKNMLENHMNDSRLCLGRLLIDYERFDEAKELYKQFLLENEDKNKQYACYEGLFSIANEQNNTSEAEIMFRKMNEIKLGVAEPMNNPNSLVVDETDREELFSGLNQALNFNSLLSPNQTIQDLLTYAQSDAYSDSLKQMIQWQYKLGMMFIRGGLHMMAIQVFELTLRTMRNQPNDSIDPLLKARFFMQIGHCYRILKSYEPALENYKMALEQNNRLSIDEYIETLMSIGMIMETMKNYEEALHRYIEIAEIYQDDSTVGNLETRNHIEKCIQRVVSFLISNN